MKKMDSLEKKLSVFFSGLAGFVLVITCVLLVVDSTHNLADANESEVLGVTYYNSSSKPVVNSTKKESDTELKIDNSKDNNVLLNKGNNTKVVDVKESKAKTDEPADTFVDETNNKSDIVVDDLDNTSHSDEVNDVTDNNVNSEEVQSEDKVSEDKNDAQIDDGAAAFVNDNATLTDSESEDVQNLENAGVEVEY